MNNPRGVDKAFALGVEDYIRKPFGAKELTTRVEKVLSRRSSQVFPHGHRIGGISLNADSSSVWVDKCEVQLTPKEYSLLDTLVEKKNSLLSRTCLMETVWGMDDSMVESHTVDEHVYRLRKKLGRVGQSCIRTVSRKGYIFKPPY